MQNTEFNPLVTIIIPVYNGSNFIKEAIDSALEQTYKNIEIIVVNDGSKDETEEIAKSYGDRIRYFSKENGGVATALNLAIKEAQGEYLSWLSHDDLYYPNKIERQIEELEKLSPPQRNETILFSHFDILNANENIRYEIPKIENFRAEEPFYIYNMLDVFFSSKLCGCTLLFPRDVFKNHGYFNIEHKTIQDYSLFISFFKAGIKYQYIPEVLVTSRHHKNQDTLKLMPLHLKELNYLYHWAFDLFKCEFQNMPLWQFEHFLNIMKIRTLDKVYAHMLSEWANGEWNENKTILWMYWENKEEVLTPDAIRLSWKTIINHNRNDFQIKILTEDDVLNYLPEINQNYNLFEQIAHKADYIRFLLLYKYGGVWIDSDTILFRSMKDVKEKINENKFVCNGYKKENGEIFTLIGFLACKPKNKICNTVINYLENFIETNLVKGIQPKWDEFGSFLSDIIDQKDRNEFYLYPVEYFSPYKVFQSENKFFEETQENIYNFITKTNPMAFGQSLAHSVRSDEFKALNENQLITSNFIYGDMFRLGYNQIIENKNYNFTPTCVIKKKNILLRLIYQPILRTILIMIRGKDVVRNHFDPKYKLH